ncbi:MAG: outer membrane protein assembly factor BamB [Rhodocyclales bacterium CG_4_9_14_3_um_filter_68_10]|nr:MAG: outer membrane protein assembly factor BamB [Rhodocyclales bacterium CG_4_9_14_3_um_filter_68_10]
MERRRIAGLLACACLAATLAGCSTLDAINPFSSAPKQKMAELAPIPGAAALTIRWQGAVGRSGGHVFSPAVVGSSVFAAAADGTLARYDEGRERWRIAAGRALSGGVGADGKRVVVGTPKGEVLAFDAGGKPLWNVRVSSEVLAAPAVRDDLVIVRSGDNRLYALDAADGKRRWIYQRETPSLTLRSAAGVAVAGDVVLAGFPGGKLVAVSIANGAPRWEASVSIPKGATELERVADVASTPLVAGGQVCAAAFQGKVACFDAAKGTPVWSRDLSSVAGIDADARHLYVTDERSVVHALDRRTGTSVWRNDKLSLRGLTRALALAGYVAVADSKGYVHLLREGDGTLAARIATDGSAILAAPRALDAGLLVQSSGGGLYAIALP